MIIAFAGHSVIASNFEVKELVKEEIRNIMTDVGTVTCYFGGYGDFDEICAQACRELKKENADIEMIYVTPYIRLKEQVRIEEMQRRGLYDRSIYPPIENTPPRFAISKRNEWMMKKADLIIAYVNCSYGGAYKSLRVAKSQKKRIVNICDLVK